MWLRDAGEMWLEVIKAISKLGSYEASRTILHVLSFFHQMTECGGNLGPRIICLSFKIEGIWTLILYNRVSKLVYNIQEKNKTTTTTLLLCESSQIFSNICDSSQSICILLCNICNSLTWWLCNILNSILNIKISKIILLMMQIRESDQPLQWH